MKLQELSDAMPGIEIKGNPLVEIAGIAYDSRHVQPGDLFVAWKGEKTDGALYVREAVDRGAVALASDHPPAVDSPLPVLRVDDARRFLAAASRILFLDPAAQLRLVAVTGTNGKTTTCSLLDAIFRRAGLRACQVGTLGMKIGNQPFPSSHTTPEASDLTAFLGRALQSGCTHGALEVSSHALSLKRVFGMRFAVGVFSNLTPEHLDFHRDMESYYQAKRLLFFPEGGNGIEAAVVNIDDPYGMRLAAEASVPVVRYGEGAGCDICILSRRIGAEGTDLRLATPQGEISIRARLVGRPNLYNIMAAAGAALRLGITPEQVRAGIESVGGVPGRMERVGNGDPCTVIVDYAHTPDALEKLLQTAREFTHGRLIAVFGCGGDRDRVKRPLMGEIAARLSDHVCATSDNPRTEDPTRILAEIEPGLKRGPAPYQLQPDRREAIRTAIGLAHAGDVVVIAGKGHETYQIIGTRVIPFDDREVAAEIMHGPANAQGE